MLRVILASLRRTEFSTNTWRKWLWNREESDQLSSREVWSRVPHTANLVLSTKTSPKLAIHPISRDSGTRAWTSSNLSVWIARTSLITVELRAAQRRFFATWEQVEAKEYWDQTRVETNHLSPQTRLWRETKRCHVFRTCNRTFRDRSNFLSN